MNLVTKLGAGLALAGGALGVVAPASNAASTYVVVHDSASYTSRASCQTNHDGAMAHIKRVFTYRAITYNGACNYNKTSGRWTYGHITYVTSGGGAMWGDRLIYRTN